MIVRDMMTTHLVTVESEDMLSHAAHLLRQYQFHHLPVVRNVPLPRAPQTAFLSQQFKYIFQGLVTTQDIAMAIALAQQEEALNSLARPWQERRVAEVMQHPQVWVTPTTSVAAAAQLLVERGMNCLPVIGTDQEDAAAPALLVGLLTRSDMLLALARALGACEPGTQVGIQLPAGQMAPLARALLAADELHIGICSILAVPHEQCVSLRLCTINPGPWLAHLKQEGIVYVSGDSYAEGKQHV